jgi:hypothetical protein
VDYIKIIRLGWVGHIIRMEDERIPKKVRNGKFHNTIPVGKPRTRKESIVRSDTSQILGICRCRRQAEDREEWRSLLRMAKAQERL